MSGDLVCDQRIHVDPDASEQAGAGPVQRLTDFAMRVRLNIKTHDAQARLPQKHAGRQPGDSGSDDRYVIARCGVHDSSVSRRRVL